MYLLNVVAHHESKDLTAPLITVMNKSLDGYENPEMLRVLAGHMFIHVVEIIEKKHAAKKKQKKVNIPVPIGGIYHE